MWKSATWRARERSGRAKREKKERLEAPFTTTDGAEDEGAVRAVRASMGEATAAAKAAG